MTWIGLLLAVPLVNAVPSEARQLLVVVTEGWDATQGTARAFERAPSGGWEPAFGAVPVSLGRSGLGWGLGLHGDGPPPESVGGPVKREGDGRSPAGVFYLASATGYGVMPPPGTRVHYTVATPSLKCVDDPRSRQYNRIVDTSRSLRDFDSFEDMRRDDDLYRLVVVVAHNVLQHPGAGSCIFLHQRLEPGSVTAGCSAFDAAALDRIVGWLDPGAQPVLVQLPRPIYEELRQAWTLPAAP